MATSRIGKILNEIRTPRFDDKELRYINSSISVKELRQYVKVGNFKDAKHGSLIIYQGLDINRLLAVKKETMNSSQHTIILSIMFNPNIYSINNFTNNILKKICNQILYTV